MNNLQGLIVVFLVAAFCFKIADFLVELLISLVRFKIINNKKAKKEAKNKEIRRRKFNNTQKEGSFRFKGMPYPYVKPRKDDKKENDDE